MELVVSDDSKKKHETLDLTKELKTQFLGTHYFFQYNSVVWTQGNPVALFLEFKDPSSAIRDIIEKDDKLMFREFPETIKNNIIHRAGGQEIWWRSKTWT